MTDSAEFYRRHLPHWQPYGAVFFVTFRLKFSLPRTMISSPRERQRTEVGHLTDGESFVQWDRFLDTAASGPRWLERPDVAHMVKDALLYRDGREYTLHAFCIMPNHVHAVIEPLCSDASLNARLDKIMKSLKGYTARNANVLLCREGAFWQDETYDRVVRDDREFARIVQYILNNPVKAGLVSQWTDWPWTYCRDESTQS